MQESNNKYLVILGLASSGESTLKYFLKNRINILAWDDDKSVRYKIKKKYKKILLQNIYSIDPKKIFMIIVSPGIDLKSIYFKKFNKFRIPIYRDLEIFTNNVNYKKVIAVTGTNGKSTTVSMIANMISKKNKNFFIGGNLKPPLLSALMIKEYNKYVIELSSYQLESAPSFKSYISILLNISEDHIDRYGNMKNYKLTKKNIFKNLNNNQYAIISIDDKYSNSIYREIKKASNKVIPISLKKNIKNGVSLLNKNIIDNFFNKNIFDLSNLKLKNSGNQNDQNILVLYIVSRILKYNKNLFIKTLQTFKGLKYRSEIIYKSNKLLVVNDSKATNLSSTLHSIESYNNIHLIMGGVLKNKNFSKLFLLQNKIKIIYLIGESSNYIFNKLKNNFKCKKCLTIDYAIKKCIQDTKENKDFNTILLSPACSSFDQYKNFEERGKDFNNKVRKYIGTYKNEK